MPQQPPKVYHPKLGYFPIPVSKAKTPPRICILGGGFARLYTALSLTRLSWHNSLNSNITLIDKQDNKERSSLDYTQFTINRLSRSFALGDLADIQNLQGK